MIEDITVVLNGYKRPHRFQHQINAVECQTFPASKIMFWQNQGAEFDKNLVGCLQSSVSNVNWGVWARFAYALNARTEYVCVFDDDTIPGNRWFENCVETMKTHNGLLGTIGLIFENSDYRSSLSRRYGWDGPIEECKRVDIVGHSWFFRREWLSYFWREVPRRDACAVAGEDIHFSAMLQKYGKINTYVPRHPANDMSLWGSIPKTAWEYGADNVAIAHTTVGQNGMLEALNYEIQNGFKLIKEGG